MYGLIFENFSGYVKITYGEDAWDNCARMSGLEIPTFGLHQVYPEALLGKIAKKTFTTLGCNDDEFFEGMGFYFVEFAGEAGYGDILALLGRQLRDFLMGLDNLHEYLKFSYPRLRGPSFFVDEENQSGLKLFYRSKRKGFANYVMGQLKAVATTYYKIDVAILLTDQKVEFDTVHCVYELKFANNTTVKQNSDLVREEARLPAVSSAVLFDIFPFLIIYGEDMVVQSIGRSINTILPKLVGQKMNEFFDIIRPLIEFSFQVVLARSNNIFELQTNEPIEKLIASGGELGGGEGEGEGDDDGNLMEEEVDKSLHLKGQMNFNPDWNVVMFLGSPAVADLNGLTMAGLYICDLSMHDFSRDLLLASGQQQVVDEDITADIEKSQKMEVHLKEFDVELGKKRNLLKTLMPELIAKLWTDEKNPITAVDTFRFYDNVSIIVNDVIGFLDIATKCDAPAIVGTLSQIFGIFDNLAVRNNIFKMDTVKDSFIGVGGAPEEDSKHAQYVADIGLDMRDCMQFVQNPVTNVPISIRLGAHSGKCVAGIVGIKVPRYCLFGDPIETAKKLMQMGQAQMLQVSNEVKTALPAAYAVKERGKITVKGKGDMVTYFVEKKEGRSPPSLADVSGTVEEKAAEAEAAEEKAAEAEAAA